MPSLDAHVASRRNTLLSRAGLHLNGVTRDFEAFDWIVNRRRYSLRPGRLDAFVVVTNDLDRTRVLQKLGPPATEERCGEEHVWLYHGAPRYAPRL